MYHDLGNLNFTFIANAGDGAFDFATFCRPVLRALASLGVPGVLSGRNDMTIGGKKFSGNAQYFKKGRVMHHGTLLYDCELSAVAAALRMGEDKITSKGIASVRSRVTNIRPYMREYLPIGAFIDALRGELFAICDMEAYDLTEADRTAVAQLRADVYNT